MGTLLSYSGLSTKIGAMQSKLMTEKQYQEISQLESVPQVVAYLKKQPGFKELWTDLDENSLHRGDIEKLLTHTIHQNFAKIYKFANPSQRTFMALYFKRYEIAVMKECLRRVFDKTREGLNLSLFKDFFDRHSKLDLEKLTQANTIEEFVNSLKGTEYYSPLSKIGEEYTPLLFDYGMALDQYYFANIWSVKDKLFKKKICKRSSKPTAINSICSTCSGSTVPAGITIWPRLISTHCSYLCTISSPTRDHRTG